MGVGEHPSKIRNMVAPNIEHFRRLYSRPLASLRRDGLVHQESEGATFQQDITHESRRLLAERLPSTLRAALPASPSAAAVNVALRAIVHRSSARQTVKGVITGGVLRSTVYAYRKISRAQKTFMRGGT